MRKHKSGTLPLEMLLTIILACALFFGTLWGIAMCTRLSAQAEEDYTDLIKLIDKIAGGEKGDMDVMGLHMDSGTAIVLINANSEAAFLLTNQGYLGFERPFDCPDDKSCIFLCKSREGSSRESYGRCTSVVGLEERDYTFTAWCRSAEGDPEVYDGCQGGVVFERGLVFAKPRLRGVEVENLGDGLILVDIPVPKT